MSLLYDMVEGFVTGLYQSVADNGMPQFGGQGRGRIDRLCAELGWAVDERVSDGVRLHFTDANGVRRIVGVCNGDADVVVFLVSSIAAVQTVPPEVTEYLVMRHQEIAFGAWTVTRLMNDTYNPRPTTLKIPDPVRRLALVNDT